MDVNLYTPLIFSQIKTYKKLNTFQYYSVLIEGGEGKKQVNGSAKVRQTQCIYEYHYEVIFIGMLCPLVIMATLHNS